MLAIPFSSTFAIDVQSGLSTKFFFQPTYFFMN